MKRNTEVWFLTKINYHDTTILLNKIRKIVSSPVEFHIRKVLRRITRYSLAPIFTSDFVTSSQNEFTNKTEGNRNRSRPDSAEGIFSFAEVFASICDRIWTVDDELSSAYSDAGIFQRVNLLFNQGVILVNFLEPSVENCFKFR
jgi:hypothetical protein